MFPGLFRHRGLGINLIASVSFLLLAMYGWGLDWDILGNYLLVIIGLLIGLIAVAAVFGLLVRKWLRSRKY